MESNNICIYTKQPHDDAKLKSGDHVILAAIGGQKSCLNLMYHMKQITIFQS